MNCVLCGAENAGDSGYCAECNSRRTTSSSAPPTPPVGGAPARVSSLAFVPGETFGARYTIVEEVGSGGMGHVYKAIDNRLGKTVALKLVRPELASRAQALERFRRELGLAQQVSHPNVCRVHDLGEVGGIHYISMEFIEGQTLEDLIHSVGHLSPRQAVALGRQICAGLLAVHEQGIVHRDLKPGNVMVDRSGRAVVMDFGMAYHPEADRLTAEGAVLGTLAYLSPEQARGEPTDVRSDIYCVGLILFEMLAGRRPPGDGVALPLALRDSAEACPPPGRFAPEVPPALDVAVLRCLARERSRRFSSVTELAGALEQVASTLSSGAPITQAGVLLGRRPSRGRALPLVVAAAVAVAVLSVWGLRSWMRIPPEGRPVVAVLPLAVLGGDPADDYLGVGIADTLITRLAGLSSVTVVSRAATLEYRGRAPKARSIARDLGVNLIVQGGVQRLGRKLRVTLNLVRPDESVAWGQDYEGSLDDLFLLQGRLAEGLTSALQVTLTRAERERLARPPAANAVAFADYAQARALLERPDVPGNVGRAIDLFKAAIGKDPGFALAHAGLGEAFWQRYQETKEAVWATRAMESITEALRLDPDQGQVRFALAVVYHGTGRTEAAVEELRRALALQPGSDDAHHVLGQILVDQGRAEEAIPELSKAVELRPSYWRHHATLGYAYFRMGRYPEAIAAFFRVTGLQPDNPWGFQMLGTAYHASGDTRRALENYEHAIALGPDALAHTNIGNIHYAEGRFADAARAFEEAARLEPNSPTKQRNLGDAYLRLRQQPKARRAYERAVELSQSLLRVNPRDALTLAMLAVYEAKLGRRSEAARHVREAVALAPTDGEVLYRKAVVHALAGKRDGAMAALEEALSRGYSASLARQDDDLADLRGLSAYRKLVARSQ